MALPVLFVAGAVAVGSGATSVLIGAGINRLTGTKNTRETMLADGVLGATGIPAAAGLFRAGRTGLKFRKYIPAGKPTMQTLGRYTHTFGGYITPIATKPEFYAGVALTMAIQSRPAWMSVIRKKQLNTAIDLFNKSEESESPSRNLTSRRKGGTTSRSFSKQKRQLARRDKVGDGPTDSRSRGKTYCNRHRQYDFCKKYNI